MLAAIFFPFLELSIAGLSRKASLLDAAHRLLLRPRRAALGRPRRCSSSSFPLIRAAALGYTLLPAPPPPPAAPRRRPRLPPACRLRPWAMAEVFLIGVVVALVKIGGMATVTLGPAFWAMAGLVLLVVYEASSLDEWSIWQLLDPARSP